MAGARAGRPDRRASAAALGFPGFSGVNGAGLHARGMHRPCTLHMHRVLVGIEGLTARGWRRGASSRRAATSGRSCRMRSRVEAGGGQAAALGTRSTRGQASGFRWAGSGDLARPRAEPARPDAAPARGRGIGASLGRDRRGRDGRDPPRFGYRDFSREVEVSVSTLTEVRSCPGVRLPDLSL
jgi:hypothetical protein